MNGGVGVGLPWPSLLAFVRLVSNPLDREPMSVEAAWSQAEQWLARPPAWTPMPTERRAPLLAELLPGAGERASLVPDAHPAALAMEYGLVLQSTDRDFSRFEGLRWENPLAC